MIPESNYDNKGLGLCDTSMKTIWNRSEMKADSNRHQAKTER